MRIVSLLPSATEIVFALGLDDQLLGVTDECDWPTAARDKRVVVRSRQPSGMTPGQIDDWVRAEAPNGGLYRLDDAAIAAISPELLLTQDLCRVCAVPTGDVDAALARIGCPATVVTLEPQRLDEVIASVGDVADAAGEPDRGRQLVDELNGRLEAVRHAVSGRPAIPTLVLSGSTRRSPPATGSQTSSPRRAASPCSAHRAGARPHRAGTRRCAPIPRSSSSPRAAHHRSTPWCRPTGSFRPSSSAAGSWRSTSPDRAHASSTASRRSPRSCIPTPGCCRDPMSSSPADGANALEAARR